MTTSDRPDAAPQIVTDDERIADEKVSQIIEEFESESLTRQLGGSWRLVAGVLAAGLSVYGLYWTQVSITTQVYRASFLMITLVLSFLLYPMLKRQRQRVTVADIALALLAVLTLGFLILNYEDALQRSTRPTQVELALGGLLIVLVLEATRRTTGWILPATALGFMLYALLGPYVPEPFDHRGYGFPRIIGKNYLTLEGVFGVPIDVAATFIVLFTIYGAVLEYSGAGKFFLDWSFAALGRSRSGAGPGRTVTAAGFLLGTVSGSGVATTVTLGSLAWPMLKKGGYDRNTGGAILAAAGIGALLSPPTLGAAAFLIAEYLSDQGITYLDVLVMACIPTVLYYLSCLLMIEADSRRMHTQAVDVQTMPLLRLTLTYGYHFTSLFAVAVLMVFGMTPFLAVFWSIVIAFALSFLRPETRLTSLRALAAGVALAVVLLALGERLSVACFWGMMLATGIAAVLVLRHKLRRATDEIEDRRLLLALESGGKGVISIAATTATAGVIVSLITLTGLGLRIPQMIVALSGGSLFLTVLLAAVAVWVLGLAVPVTASYIIAAVMVVPALTDPQVGVSHAAAHMFIFYYAVLADVSPPTALSPFAAAALTGGNPFRTMMLTWKYCLPAFLVPFMFTLSREGEGLLMRGDPMTIVWTFATSCVAVAALAVAFGGWFVKQAGLPERVLMGLGGLALMYANINADAIGAALLISGALVHLVRVRRTTALATEVR
jgi:TRAP transporter 4TM/12TM fusion protein